MISIKGTKMQITNFKALLFVSDTLICIQEQEKEIRIHGTQLQVSAFHTEEVVVCGMFETIEFLK